MTALHWPTRQFVINPARDNCATNRLMSVRMKAPRKERKEIDGKAHSFPFLAVRHHSFFAARRRHSSIITDSGDQYLRSKRP